MASYTDITNTLNFSVAFKPTSAFPLDARSMFGSFAAAEAAAKTAVVAGSSDSVYYIGMGLTVFENDVVTKYTIQPDKTLKEDGKSFIADSKSIEIDGGTTIQMKDFGVQYYAHHDPDEIFDNAEGNYTFPDAMPTTATEAFVKIDNAWYKYTVGTGWAVYDGEPKTSAYFVLTQGWIAGLEPKVVSAGESYALAWFEPSATTVEGLSGIVAVLRTDVDSNAAAITELTNTTGKLTTDLTAETARATEAETALATDIKTINDTAVFSVEAGATNGSINVNTDNVVTVYTLPTAKTDVLGGVKVDGTSITATEEGVISVEAVDKSKVTGLDAALTATQEAAVTDAKDYADTTFVDKTSIATSTTIADTAETASDAKVASEKALIEALTWKTTM